MKNAIEIINLHGGISVHNPCRAAVSCLTVSAGDTGDTGLIPGSGRCPVVGNGSPLQYSCLENPMDRGAWQATVHGVAKNQTQLSTQHLLGETEILNMEIRVGLIKEEE